MKSAFDLYQSYLIFERGRTFSGFYAKVSYDSALRDGCPSGHGMHFRLGGNGGDTNENRAI